MRSLKVAGIMLVVVALASIAMAGPNSMGIKDVSKVTFVAPIRVGTTLLPAGDYVVRHTMEGEEHIMVFQSENSKKADHNQTVYSLDANNVRTLQELVFRGDTAKHVF